MFQDYSIRLISLLSQVEISTPVIFLPVRWHRVEVSAPSFLFFFFAPRWARTWYMLHDLRSNKQDGGNTRCDSVFEQLKEFKIHVKKGISDSLKKSKHFALKNFALQH